MSSRRGNWLLGFLGLVSISVSASCWHSQQQARIEQDWGIPVTVQSTFAHLQSLELPRAVDRLGWLEASRLKKLEVSDSAIQEILAELPDTLEILLAQNLRVARVDFPPRLIELDIRHSDLSSVEGLPETLQSLAIGGSRIVERVQLPPNLTKLVLEEFDPTVISVFPGSVTSLTIIGSQASTWRGDFPLLLENLEIRARRLEAVPELPANLVSLVLATNLRVRSVLELPPHLTTFESEGVGLGQIDDLLSLKSLRASGSELPGKIPESLQHLSFIFQGEASPVELNLPELPNLQTLALINYPGTVIGMPSNLKELDISGSPHIQLEDLPRTLRKLVMARRESVDLSKLPQNLEFLDISYIDTIEHSGPALPKLATLVCQGNSGTLPILGRGLKVLDVSDSPALKELPRDLPSTLTELHIRTTGITSLPMGKLTGLEILDVCDSKIEPIKALPARLMGLRAHVNQLDRQIQFPNSLLHLAIRTPRDCAADEGLWGRMMEFRWKEGGGS
jgi:hypothetical protein